MISQAGVAVFVFGNKAGRPGEVVLADGMMEEFEIARELGLLIVPVGVTGYVAKELHEKVSKSFQQYFPNVRGLKSALAELGKSGTPTTIVQRVLKFIDIAAKGRS